MREIKFRGKDIQTKQWVYGDFYRSTDYLLQEKNEKTNYYIAPYNYYGYRVSLETVGQYTELKDRNSKEIYEGDIVRCCGGEKYNGIWEYDRTEYISDIRYIPPMISELEHVEVVGNVHENPELLEVLGV